MFISFKKVGLLVALLIGTIGPAASSYADENTRVTYGRISEIHNVESDLAFTISRISGNPMKVSELEKNNNVKATDTLKSLILAAYASSSILCIIEKEKVRETSLRVVRTEEEAQIFARQATWPTIEQRNQSRASHDMGPVDERHD